MMAFSLKTDTARVGTLVPLACILLVLIVGSGRLEAQFAIRIAEGDYATTSGQSVALPVEIESPEPVTGFSFGVRHDAQKLTLESVRRAPALDAVWGEQGPDMDFYAVNEDPAGGAGFTVGVILGPRDPGQVLPAGVHAVFEADYSARAGVSGAASVSVTSELGNPLVALVIDVGGGQSQVVEGSEVDVLISVPFQRGDTDQDDNLNITDAVLILLVLFQGQGQLAEPCGASLDIDGDNNLVLTDAVFLLQFLFARGVPPAPPFPDCGQPDGPIAPELICREYTPCD